MCQILCTQDAEIRKTLSLPSKRSQPTRTRHVTNSNVIKFYEAFKGYRNVSIKEDLFSLGEAAIS